MKNKNLPVLYPARPVTVRQRAAALGTALSTFALGAYASAAEAPEVTSLLSTATSSGDAVKTAVATIAGVAMLIAVILWAVRKAKPHN